MKLHRTCTWVCHILLIAFLPSYRCRGHPRLTAPFPSGTALTGQLKPKAMGTTNSLARIFPYTGEIWCKAGGAGFTRQRAAPQCACPQSDASPSNETISAELRAELPSGWDRLRRRPRSAVGPPSAHSTRFGLIDFVIARLIEQLQQHYQEKVSGLGRGVGGDGGGRGIGAGERAKWVFPFLSR